MLRALIRAHPLCHTRAAKLCMKSLSMPRPSTSRSSSSSTVEIVEDSEPEREARRNDKLFGYQSSEAPRKKQKLATNPEEVIDLTDLGPGEASSNSLKDRVVTATQTVLQQSNLVSPLRSSPEARRTLLALDKFAYQNIVTKPFSRSVSTTSVDKDALDSEVVKPVTSRARKKERLIDFGVPESEISQLAKCVCCNTRWTTRKTTIQKLNHIRTCSKKHSITAETVGVLLRQELKFDVKDRGEPATNEKTHFEDLVQDALPKKKTRRKRTGPTVLEYGDERRETMLKRARAILGPVVSYGEEGGHADFTVATQAIRAISHSSTRGSTSKGAPVSHEYSTDCSEPRSPAQAFLPSRLKYQVQRRSNDKTDLEASLSSIGRGKSDECSNFGPRVDALTSRKSDGSTPAVQSRSTKDPLPARVKIKSIKSPKSPKCKPSAKGEPQRRRKKPREEDVSSDHWQEIFRSKIIEDDELYHQILRYEPIHFDTFEHLAPENGSVAQRRRKILAFLDEQAINFYGYRPQTRRRRRSQTT